MARGAAALATLLTLLVAAAPAAASSANATSVLDDNESCQIIDRTWYTADLGETNHVTVVEQELFVEWPFFGPPCDDLQLNAAVLTDPSATIRPRGACRFTIQQTNRAVNCPMDDGLEVYLRDGDDTFVNMGSQGTIKVSCGPGNDVVVGNVDVASDCETVLPL